MSLCKNLLLATAINMFVNTPIYALETKHYRVSQSGSVIIHGCGRYRDFSHVSKSNRRRVEQFWSNVRGPLRVANERRTEYFKSQLVRPRSSGSLNERDAELQWISSRNRLKTDLNRQATEAISLYDKQYRDLLESLPKDDRSETEKVFATPVC